MTDSLPTYSSLPTVAVLGCGWLGLPLAKALVAQGHYVVGSTTTPSQLLTLRDAGIMPFLLSLAPTLTATDTDTLQAMLTGIEVLILNVPPRRSATSHDYASLLQPVCEAAEACGVSAVLFVSSTGVYPDEARLMQEQDALATAEASSSMLRAEALFASPKRPWQTTVVRLGGLFGPGRLPGRFLAGKQDVALPNAPVNLIHLADCIGVLTSIIDQQVWGYTFNACAAQHPSRQEFYTLAAQQLGLAPPAFQAADTASGKSIDSGLLREKVAYKFQHDNLLAAL
ncbi:NAD(P)H-binding protein [Hymenobacter sp. GOD-10R]|uniref:NAD(P)H-binding protein n=1 Tax=Hymenobacter sp. GOD-10R TaxID=3093922 RepID=UPI002D78CD9C|nr:NAD(P)H-binding protein [Hymenobacter sp. GOD-10R]WRQ30883.1 NAD(P)H-binding protein [Hymenobacter sp. GOD-10R]